MIKIMFVCLGNICRSPMAEFVLKEFVRRKGLEKEFLINSSATSYEEIGNDVHYGTIKKLKEVGIPVEHRKATRLTASDYDKYDYIIGMENSNIRNILRIVGEDKDKKVFRLLDFSEEPRDIADPWYSGDFDTTYSEIYEGCEALLNKLL